jgi:oxygen-independent coproporphyrinogen III oxidase
MQAQSAKPDINNNPDCPVEALYVHIPFCRSKCGYCDFYSLPGAGELAEPCVEAIAAELQRCASNLTAPMNSIFIGGGTPTSLDLPLLQRLMAILAEYRDNQTEFSIEANPCTITGDVAEILHNAGVNRVNLGAQSFVQAELDAIGRIHGPDEIQEAWRTLRNEGIQRLGLDLIYAAPRQNLDSWRFSLDRALSLKPDHLSCYALTIESDTDIGRQRDSGEFVEMDDSDQADCYNATVESASAAGLKQYEISNFATPGKQCRHNITYWRNEPYLGLGPAAASYIRGVRKTNNPDIKAYIQALHAGHPPPCCSEKLTGRAEMGETIMLGLRMTQGVDRSAFIARFGVDIPEAFGRTLERYCDLGALLLDRQRLRIAPAAMIVSNTIMADILDEV